MLIALCICSVLLGQMQNKGLRAGSQDVLGKVVFAIAAPLGRPLANLGTNIGLFFKGGFNGPAYEAKIRALEAQVAVAKLYTEVLEEYQQEIESLKGLMNLPTLGKKRIVAPIWASNPRENMITIGAGSKQSVIRGAAVVCAEGLVGVVHVVGPDTSQVQLLSSPLPFKIGATVQSEVPVAGLLHGEGENRLILELESTAANVKQGDLVITSGFSERIPRGIPIGKVVQVRDDPDFGTKLVQVFPHVELARLQSVIVLR